MSQSELMTKHVASRKDHYISLFITGTSFTFYRWLDTGAQCDLDVAVDADSGEEDTVEVGEGDWSMRFIIDEVTEGVVIEIQYTANH